MTTGSSPSIRYDFWIQTSITEDDEDTKIGQMTVKIGNDNKSVCLDLILVDLRDDGNGNTLIDVEYELSGVQTTLTLGYFPSRG